MWHRHSCLFRGLAATQDRKPSGAAAPGRGTDKSVCATSVLAAAAGTAGTGKCTLNFAAMKTLIRFLPLLVAIPAFAQSTADTIIAREVQTSRAYETLSHLTDD